MKLSRLSWGIFVLGIVAGVLRGESADVSAGNLKVRVTAVSAGVFRVSLNSSGEARGISSVYLDPKLVVGDVGKVSEKGGIRRIVTEMGEVDVDLGRGTYSLLDARGGVLIPAAGFGSVDQRGILQVHVGWPEGKGFEVYGCGNGADSLMQRRVRTRVGNGVAVQPFFWSPAGFATFVLGSDENKPAQCEGKIEGGAVSWAVPGAAADLYLIISPTLGDASRALLGLTGKPPVPTRWAFGYLQSRWGWVDRAYIEDALKQFESRKLPVDAFIFDFEWYTTFPDYQVKAEGVKGFSDFDWNAKLFPQPVDQVKKLHDAGVHFVGIRKPRMGNSDTLAMVRSKGWGFESKSNVDGRGLLFANPDLRKWYESQMEPLLKVGIDGWWNDEGEFSYSNYLYWNQAEREALDAVRPGARLWTINRAFQPGTARLGAAAWTGDIRSSWAELRRTPTALLNWSVAGMPYGACDIGGYSGEVTPELLVRWMEAGTFFPVMRAHSELQAKPHFPWLFGDAAEAAIRKALDLRYQLVPMLYSLGHEVNETGEPIMRPLVMEYPGDAKVANLSSEWLIGRGLLAAPVLDATNHRSVYLPDDIWYEFSSGKRVNGGGEIEGDVALDAVPIYVRGGTILPLGPVVQHTRDLASGPLEVRVYPGRDGKFTLVEDDGETDGYAAGKMRKTVFKWDDRKRVLSWARSGDYDGSDCFRSMRVNVADGKSVQGIEQELSASGNVSLPK